MRRRRSRKNSPEGGIGVDPPLSAVEVIDVAADDHPEDGPHREHEGVSGPIEVPNRGGQKAAVILG